MSTDATDGKVKVRFRLAPDKDGWPPVENEGLWAEPVGPQQFRIASVPWFAGSIALDDVVEAHLDDGELWATRKVAGSGRLTLWVYVRKSGALWGNERGAIELLRSVCETSGGEISAEIAGQWGLIAFDIGPDANRPALKALLRAGEEDGRWVWEEGCYDDEWSLL